MGWGRSDAEPCSARPPPLAAPAIPHATMETSVGGSIRARQAERDVRSRAWPLSFVAQIDFAELHAVRALADFPPAGRLLLFCDPFDWPWGEREDQTRAQALFTDQPAEVL